MRIEKIGDVIVVLIAAGASVAYLFGDLLHLIALPLDREQHDGIMILILIGIGIYLRIRSQLARPAVQVVSVKRRVYDLVGKSSRLEMQQTLMMSFDDIMGYIDELRDGGFVRYDRANHRYVKTNKPYEE